MISSSRAAVNQIDRHGSAHQQNQQDKQNQHKRKAFSMEILNKNVNNIEAQ